MLSCVDGPREEMSRKEAEREARADALVPLRGGREV